MAISFNDYKGLKILDTTPIKNGGISLNQNFQEIADRVGKCNYTSVVMPQPTDDSASGFAVGSRWINTLTNIEYVCKDSTAGAALWITGDSTIDIPSTYSLYVDGGRADVYTERGTIEYPYKTVQSALNESLVKMGTGTGLVSVSINIKPSTYDENASFTFPNKNKRLSISGQGSPSILKSLSVTSASTLTTNENEYNYLDISSLQLGLDDSSLVSPCLEIVGISAGTQVTSSIDNSKLIAASDYEVIKFTSPVTPASNLYIHNKCIIRNYGTTTALPTVSGENGNLYISNSICENLTTQNINIIDVSEANSLYISDSVIGNVSYDSGIPISVSDTSSAVINGANIFSETRDSIAGDTSSTIKIQSVYFNLSGSGIAINLPSATVLAGDLAYNGTLTGTDISTKITASSLVKANTSPMTSYTPTTAADWDTVPTDVQEALDEVAAGGLSTIYQPYWVKQNIIATLGGSTTVTVNKNIYVDTSSFAYDINLPDATTNDNYGLCVTNTGSMPLTINPAGSDTINGETELILFYENSSVILYAEGTTWRLR